jgi:hypothetical protein
MSVIHAQAMTPHSKALYEAGKQMLVESISVGREFCKFMVGVSTGAIPLYLALLQFALPKDYRPSWWWKGVAAIAPGAIFLVASLLFALGVFPRTGKFSLDLPEEIDQVRDHTIKRLGNFALAGFVCFTIAALASIIVIVSGLRVKEPVKPTKPTEIRIVK